MSLLEEIQSAAIDKDSDLGQVLRMCKLLASRLDSRPLEEWLLWESNGYPAGVELPDYRVLAMRLKGHFVGGFGSALRSVSIPPHTVPERLRKGYTTYPCRESITAVAEMVKSKSDLHVPLSGLAPVLGMNVYSDMNCLEVWGEFGDTKLIEILNSVRNRVLDFVLALWKENPNAGEIAGAANKVASETVTQIFHTTVYGGAANVVGTAQNSTVVLAIQAGDFRSLEQALVETGVDAPDIAELQEALAAEPSPPDAKHFGPRVAAWVGKMTGKAASGAWQVGVAAGGKLLAAAIARYYGLPV